jgi:hypothetical protein
MEKSDKILLIAGCSHAAGSEMNGCEDSVYNRSNSFGNILARKVGMVPINIAQHGLSNQGIVRTILNWFHYQYNPNIQEVHVLVAWTESIRVEFPRNDAIESSTSIITRSANWLDNSTDFYYRFSMGDYAGKTNAESYLMQNAQRFIVENEIFFEINSLYNILLLQHFFQSQNVKYVMCNTMHMFTSYVKQIENLLPLVDFTKYRHMMHDGEAFYPKYKNIGYENPKAKYWHHSEEPHRLFADDLYQFIEENKCF